MVTTGSLFSQTLQDITTTKLDELAKKRRLFEDQKLALLAIAENEQDAVQRLVRLSDGVKSCFAVAVAGGRVVRGSTNNARLEIDLKTLDRFLKQARYDPSVSSKALDRWQQTLLLHLEVQSLKFSFASLYGHLTTEWLQSKQTDAATAVSEDFDMNDFEMVSGGKKLESRFNWEQFVFSTPNIDDSAVVLLLKEIFDFSSDDSKQLKEAMQTLKQNVKVFELGLTSPGNFNSHTLKWTIKSLLTSDLLTEEKRNVLRDFLNNNVIINEVADVLNMRMSAIDSWSWGDEILLEERRQLNGSFIIYMHEDLLQAIFLHYIGIKWSVFWKAAFSKLRKSKGVWKSPRKSITSADRKRREHYLGRVAERPNLQSMKQKLYRQSYFLSQLMNFETQQVLTEQGDEEADFGEDSTTTRVQQIARKSVGAKRFRVQVPNKAPMAAPDAQYGRSGDPYRTTSGSEDDDSEFDDDDTCNQPKNPMAAKQRLLHLLSTEILIKTRLHGEITCFRSQFHNFYTSLPHSTIKLVFEFFGVSNRWLCFFERFLQAPLRFANEKRPPRRRKCGTPSSHALSEVFGEAILFCLDYKINQVAGGEPLWRLHDDFWFWSSNRDNCVNSWTTCMRFAKTMGLSLNNARTGCARMIQNRENGKNNKFAAELEKSLPQGQIRWGMLYLNPQSGRFEIDQDMVDKHINELRRQLGYKSSSIFAWIQTWNTYATTFFTANFGKPANCFGRGHVDNMLAVHQRIQRDVFSSMEEKEEKEGEWSGSVVGYLRKTIEQRFGITDIPDGYFLLPVELGGLEVQSPFIGLLQVREMVAENPGEMLNEFEEAEKKAYRSAKLRYKQGGNENMQYEEFKPSQSDESDGSDDSEFQPNDPCTFMTFDEYIKYREELNYGFQNELSDVFGRLLRQPDYESVDTDENGQVKIALNALGNQPGLKGILSNFYAMDPYWKWVAQLYGPQIIEKFGGFNIVDPGLLPMGMISLFRSGGVKWQE